MKATVILLLSVGTISFIGELPSAGDAMADMHILRDNAVSGDPVAQYNFAKLYLPGDFEGYPTKTDYEQAFRWLSKSAQQDYPPAQFLLGVLYEKGWGVDKDMAAALKWYKKAAAQRNHDAQAALDKYAN